MKRSPSMTRPSSSASEVMKPSSGSRRTSATSPRGGSRPFPRRNRAGDARRRRRRNGPHDAPDHGGLRARNGLRARPSSQDYRGRDRRPHPPRDGATNDGGRSAERRGGEECVSTCRSRWSADHKKKNKKN